MASRSGKHSKRKTPLGYHVYDHSISVTHVCLLEVLNMNINYFVTTETHPVNKAPIKSSLTLPTKICILKYQHFYNIFLQKYLRKVAELVYIARLYYPDTCHYISCCPMAKVFHMPKTKFRYRVFKKNKHILAYNAY